MRSDLIIRHESSELPVAIGLYLHIPFCRRICHYCDFAKTAAYSESFKAQYFERLRDDLRTLIEHFDPEFSTLFIGGGTPSLFSSEYDEIFDLAESYLAADAEITLEANPEDLCERNLQAWRALGINRLSIGQQSFSPEGLRFLTRFHESSREPFELASKCFKNLNIDLIYGWPAQSEEDWDHDLQMAVECGATHLSCYELTYEPATVIGRRKDRNLLKTPDDETLARFYEQASVRLKDQNFIHEEVSNWAKPGFQTRHNAIYWTDQYFIGVGAGACGYLPNCSHIGWRYQYPKNLVAYLRGDQPLVDSRSDDDWLLEYLGASVRSSYGVSTKLIREKIGRQFEPARLDKKLIKTPCLQDDVLRLPPSEWFRETAWCLGLEPCFQ